MLLLFPEACGLLFDNLFEQQNIVSNGPLQGGMLLVSILLFEGTYVEFHFLGLYIFTRITCSLCLQ